jgi:copper(I)-binding protein
MKKAIFFGLTAWLALLVTGCGGTAETGQISITDPWARPALAGGNSAVYFVIENGSGSDDVLVSASTDSAAVVELHDVVMVEVSGGDDEMSGNEESGGGMAGEGEMGGGAMQMVRQANVPVPAGGQVIFQPGSFHVMLIGLTDDLMEGESLTLKLVFEQAGEITLTVPVEQR